MATWGVVKDGFDRMKANRALLGEKKTARELYREEIEKRRTKLELVNLADLRELVIARMKSNRLHEIRLKVTSIIFLTVLVSGITWLAINLNPLARKAQHVDRASLFVTTLSPKSEENYLVKTDFYHHGSKAAESFLENGVKVGWSVSYYESGERFRLAFYEYGLVTSETYYFKEGDTIRSFPVIRDNNIHTITVTNHKRKQKLAFEFYDGKIIGETYIEIDLKE